MAQTFAQRWTQLWISGSSFCLSNRLGFRLGFMESFEQSFKILTFQAFGSALYSDFGFMLSSDRLAQIRTFGSTLSIFLSFELLAQFWNFGPALVFGTTLCSCLSSFPLVSAVELLSQFFSSCLSTSLLFQIFSFLLSSSVFSMSFSSWTKSTLILSKAF